MSRSPESDAAFNANTHRDDLYRLCASFETGLRSLQSHVIELERWKREAQQVEAEWDANKVAELLGAPLGYSSRPEIMRRVTHLVEYVKALETAGDAVASAVWKVQDWSDTRVGMTVDEWEKVRVGKEAKP